MTVSAWVLLVVPVAGIANLPANLYAVTRPGRPVTRWSFTFKVPAIQFEVTSFEAQLVECSESSAPRGLCVLYGECIRNVCFWL